MRIFMTGLAVIALALPSAGAQAEVMGRHGGPPPRAAPKPVDAKEKKAQDKAYQDALKHIPNAKKPVDPWQGVR